MEQTDNSPQVPVSGGPKLTIGVPVYNGGHLIELALSGLLEQTYRNFVLMISDNASTDGTWNILQRWAKTDARINLHRQEKNIGAMANFRFLLEKADTEYFMWHAHDDFITSDYVEKLCAILDKNPDCLNAAARTVRVGADGSTTSVDTFPDVSSSARFSRVISIIKTASPSWIYGVFRLEHLRQAYAVAERFGFVWGWDRIALLPAILNDQIRGSNEVYLQCLVTDVSEKKHRPRSIKDRIEFSERHMAASFDVFRKSRLNFFERILVFPFFYYHATTNRGYGKSVPKIIRRSISYNVRSRLGLSS